MLDEMPKKGILFDLDGTLVDSAADITASLNHVLIGHGLPPQTVPTITALIGEGLSVLFARVYTMIGFQTPDLAADVQRYLAHYAAHPVVQSELFADAASALPRLRQRGWRLGICTNKSTPAAHQVLAHFGLLDIMEVVVGAGSTPYVKPDPRPLLYALDHMGLTPADAIFVGDTAVDRDCAIAAGVRLRIVDWGTGPGVAVAPHQRLACFADLLTESGP